MGISQVETSRLQLFHVSVYGSGVYRTFEEVNTALGVNGMNNLSKMHSACDEEINSPTSVITRRCSGLCPGAKPVQENSNRSSL